MKMLMRIPRPWVREKKQPPPSQRRRGPTPSAPAAPERNAPRGGSAAHTPSPVAALETPPAAPPVAVHAVSVASVEPAISAIAAPAAALPAVVALSSSPAAAPAPAAGAESLDAGLLDIFNEEAVGDPNITRLALSLPEVDIDELAEDARDVLALIRRRYPTA